MIIWINGSFGAGKTAAEYDRTLIVPMTLVNPQYQEEIFGPIAKAGQELPHVFLDVPSEELHRRLGARVLVPEPPPGLAKTCGSSPARPGRAGWASPE